MVDVIVVTNKGFELFSKAAGGLITLGNLYIATGTSATAPQKSDTALGNENTTFGAARALATVNYAGNGMIELHKLFAFTGEVTVREAGIFDSSNNLLCREVLGENRYYHAAGGMDYTFSFEFED